MFGSAITNLANQVRCSAFVDAAWWRLANLDVPTKEVERATQLTFSDEFAEVPARAHVGLPRDKVVLMRTESATPARAFGRLVYEVDAGLYVEFPRSRLAAVERAIEHEDELRLAYAQMPRLSR